MQGPNAAYASVNTAMRELENLGVSAQQVGNLMQQCVEDNSTPQRIHQLLRMAGPDGQLPEAQIKADIQGAVKTNAANIFRGRHINEYRDDCIHTLVTTVRLQRNLQSLEAQPLSFDMLEAAKKAATTRVAQGLPVEALENMEDFEPFYTWLQLVLSEAVVQVLQARVESDG